MNDESQQNIIVYVLYMYGSRAEVFNLVQKGLVWLQVITPTRQNSHLFFTCLISSISLIILGSNPLFSVPSIWLA